MFNTVEYWNMRYKNGKGSGKGSRGELLEYKANTINNIINEFDIQDIIDFGCGDGELSNLIDVEYYVGIDSSFEAVAICRSKKLYDRCRDVFGARIFINDINLSWTAQADMTMSIDVIFHLVNEREYLQHLLSLFQHSTKYVLIYSSDKEEDVDRGHVKHRKCTRTINELFPDWKLLRKIDNKYPDQSFSDFYLYEYSPPAEERGDEGK